MNATWRCAPRGKFCSQVFRTVTLSCKGTRALTYENFFVGRRAKCESLYGVTLFGGEKVQVHEGAKGGGGGGGGGEMAALFLPPLTLPPPASENRWEEEEEEVREREREILLTIMK